MSRKKRAPRSTREFLLPKDSTDGLYPLPSFDLIAKHDIYVPDRPRVTEASEAYQLLARFFDPTYAKVREQFSVMYLNRRNNVLGISEMFNGGISSAVADLKIIFGGAVISGSSGIIISHNHPSGHTEPSEYDRSLTQRVVDAGSIFDIKVLDHIIVSPWENKYYSFAEMGTMPSPKPYF